MSWIQWKSTTLCAIPTRHFLRLWHSQLFLQLLELNFSISHLVLKMDDLSLCQLFVLIILTLCANFVLSDLVKLLMTLAEIVFQFSNLPSQRFILNFDACKVINSVRHWHPSWISIHTKSTTPSKWISLCSMHHYLISHSLDGSSECICLWFFNEIERQRVMNTILWWRWELLSKDYVPLLVIRIARIRLNTTTSLLFILQIF